MTILQSCDRNCVDDLRPYLCCIRSHRPVSLSMADDIAESQGSQDFPTSIRRVVESARKSGNRAVLIYPGLISISC